MDEVELLVHISAPSSRKDDDRCRAQALAYLDFERSDSDSLSSQSALNEASEEETLSISVKNKPPRDQEDLPPFISSNPLSQDHDFPTTTRHITPQQPAAAVTKTFDSASSFPSDISALEPEAQGTPFHASFRARHLTPKTLRNPIEQLELNQAVWRVQQRLLSRSAPRTPAGIAVLKSPDQDESTTFIEDTQLSLTALQTQLESLSDLSSTDSSPAGSTQSSPLLGRNEMRTLDHDFEQAHIPNSQPVGVFDTPRPQIIQSKLTPQGTDYSGASAIDALQSQLPESYGLGDSVDDSFSWDTTEMLGIINGRDQSQGDGQTRKSPSQRESVGEARVTSSPTISRKASQKAQLASTGASADRPSGISFSPTATFYTTTSILDVLNTASPSGHSRDHAESAEQRDDRTLDSEPPTTALNKSTNSSPEKLLGVRNDGNEQRSPVTPPKQTTISATEVASAESTASQLLSKRSGDALDRNSHESPLKRQKVVTEQTSPKRRSPRLNKGKGEATGSDAAAKIVPATIPKGTPFDFSRLCREVFAPLPATNSRTSWDQTYATDMMASLINHPPLKDKFRVRYMTRQVPPYERGCWVIDTSPWSPSLAVRFWKDMFKYIRRGNAGWGVYMHRGTQQDPARPHELGTVTVHCWGELIPHFYLLFYTFSRCQIRKTDAKWVDSRGEVVVQMVKEPMREGRSDRAGAADDWPEGSSDEEVYEKEGGEEQHEGLMDFELINRLGRW